MLLATSKLPIDLMTETIMDIAQVACAAAITVEQEVHANLNKVHDLQGPSRHQALQNLVSASVVRRLGELLKCQDSGAMKSRPMYSAKYVTIPESSSRLNVVRNE